MNRYEELFLLGLASAIGLAALIAQLTGSSFTHSLVFLSGIAVGVAACYLACSLVSEPAVWAIAVLFCAVAWPGACPILSDIALQHIEWKTYQGAGFGHSLAWYGETTWQLGIEAALVLVIAVRIIQRYRRRF